MLTARGRSQNPTTGRLEAYNRTPRFWIYAIKEPDDLATGRPKSDSDETMPRPSQKDSEPKGTWTSQAVFKRMDYEVQWCSV